MARGWPKTKKGALGQLGKDMEQAREWAWRAGFHARLLYDWGDITRAEHDQVAERMKTIEGKIDSLEDYIRRAAER